MMEGQLGYVSIVRTGPGSSIQDLGRREWARFGVPNSGPADKISPEWINHLLRNESNDAVIEISQPGFRIEPSHACEIAIAGAPCAVFLNEKSVPSSQKISLKAKDILELGAFTHGARVYVGIKGGFQTPLALGSRSFYPEITQKTYLQKGDRIPFWIPAGRKEPGFSAPKWDASWFETENLEFYPGPDYHLLSHETKETLHAEEFTISPHSSRMGTILYENLPNSLPELPTNPVYPGIVQLTSGGKLIILGPDAQVTGGYPRIMFLTEFAQSILAQKKPGQKVRFIKKSPV